MLFFKSSSKKGASVMIAIAVMMCYCNPCCVIYISSLSLVLVLVISRTCPCPVSPLVRKSYNWIKLRQYIIYPLCMHPSHSRA